MQPTVEIKIIPEYADLYSLVWRFLIYYGGRGSGKSYNIAESLIIQARDQKLRILCTREIQNTIKDSVHKLLSDIINKYGFTDYKITENSISNAVTGSEFIFKGLRHNTNEIKSMEGIDICWVEEAQSVTANSWEVLTPTIRKPGSRIIISFNRLNEDDPVWVKFCKNPNEHTLVKKVNFDTMKKYGLFPDVLEIERQIDEQSDPELYAWKWLGEPLGQADNAIISKGKVLQAMERQADQTGTIEVGVDVARMGNDRTVFKMRKGLQIIKSKVLTKKRTTEVCDYLEQFVDLDKTVLIKIDDTGVGGGVTDGMIERGYNIAAINFGSEPKDKDKYPNLISEAWFELADMIDDIGLNGHDSELLTELSNREWKMDRQGRRAVESKDDYKKRGNRSPDNADAVILAFYRPKRRKKVEYAGVR